MKDTEDKFDNIDYLKKGTDRQRRAYTALSKIGILPKLDHYDPILVGTIPINIDTENSDLDIICCFLDKEQFTQSITAHFGTAKDFTLVESQSEPLSIVANFWAHGFKFEIFGQNTPTKKQSAYQHMIVEYRLLNRFGEDFRKRILKLKQDGLKTEPAFAHALKLTGDPYEALLKLE